MEYISSCFTLFLYILKELKIIYFDFILLIFIPIHQSKYNLMIMNLNKANNYSSELHLLISDDSLKHLHS